MKKRSFLILALAFIGLSATTLDLDARGGGGGGHGGGGHGGYGRGGYGRGGWGGGGAFAGGMVTGAVIGSAAASSNRQPQTQVIYANSQPENDFDGYCNRYQNAPECQQ